LFVGFFDFAAAPDMAEVMARCDRTGSLIGRPFE
jgi:hypothetical protein